MTAAKIGRVMKKRDKRMWISPPAGGRFRE